jgi:MoaA/NifB/PqqE/SkfB family radical SAM enzyme
MLNKDLVIAITRRCNRNCGYCYRKQGELDMTPGKIKEVIQEFRPGGITLTGGETLLHPGIEEILKEVSSSVEKVSLCTNGILISPELVARLSDMKVKLYISWNEAKYCPVVVQCVLLRERRFYIPRILSSFKAQDVRFLVEYNTADSPYKTGDVRGWTEYLQEAVETAGREKKNVSYEPGYGTGDIDGYKMPCESHVFVDTDGKTYPCCLLAERPYSDNTVVKNGAKKNCPVLSQAKPGNLRGYKPYCPLMIVD